MIISTTPIVPTTNALPAMMKHSAENVHPVRTQFPESWIWQSLSEYVVLALSTRTLQCQSSLHFPRHVALTILGPTLVEVALFFNYLLLSMSIFQLE